MESAGRKNSCWHNFQQQRMRAWQPIFTPRFTIPFYLICGLIFVGLGFLLLYVASDVVEVKHDYTELVPENSSTGSFSLTLDADMEPPVWIYYELSNFFQNHRRYIKSYSGVQLSQAGGPESIQSDMGQNCNPETVRHRGGRPLYPCGLVPLSVFNDTFVLLAQREAAWEKVAIDSDAATIAWPADLQGKFRNLDPEAVDAQTGLKHEVAQDMWILERFPPVECEQLNFTGGYEPARVATKSETVVRQDGSVEEVEGIVDCAGYTSGEPVCNFTRGGQPFDCEGDYRKVTKQSWGVESGHLLVWMRIAGLPTFRKLIGKVETRLEKGTYTVHFDNNFPVGRFGGRKALVLSTGSDWGGHGDNMGLCYILVGSCCLAFGLWKLVQQLYSPRRLGDVSLLSE